MPGWSAFSGFVTKETRLTETRLSMRFKASGEGPYDVVIGMEKTTEQKEPRRYVLHVDRAGSFFAWEGDELKTLWNSLGADVPNLYGDAFGKFVTSETKRWAEVVKTSGAKLE